MPLEEKDNAIAHQIRLIEHAMKKTGIWSPTAPEWVKQYQEETFPNVWQWLQFIHLPMRMRGVIFPDHYLAPILRPFMDSRPEFHEILQLIIELDSLSPTLEKK